MYGRRTSIVEANHRSPRLEEGTHSPQLGPSAAAAALATFAIAA